jgi:hypothetical protein
MANVVLYKELEAMGSINYPNRIQNLEITRSISDDMWSLTGFVDKSLTLNAFDHILVKQRDHNGAWKNNFHGVFPSYSENYETAGNYARIRAYSLEWYLAHQFLDWQMFQTMTSTSGTGDAETTHYENPSTFITRLFYPYTYNTTSKAWIASSPATALTGISLASGQPEQVARWLLPGDNGFLSTDIIQKQFVFDTKTTKLDAIREMADYCKMIYYARTSHTTDFSTTFYMVNAANIDSTMGIPTKQTITAGSNQVFSPISKDVDYSLKYNTVSLAMVDKVNGAWYYATKTASPAPAIPIEYRVQSSDLNNGKTTALDPTYPASKTNGNAICTAKCNALYDYFTSGTTNYVFEIKARFDLEPFQLINFTGFSSPSIPTTDMRITKITRLIGEANMVRVECTDNTQWSKHRELARLFGSDFARQQQATKDKFFVNLTKIATGTIKSIDSKSGTAIVKLERGDYAEWGENLVRARLLNQ